MVLLDTDMLSEVLKQKNPTVVTHATAYLNARFRFTFSALTRYEVLRGLKAKDAAIQLEQFDAFCLRSEILPVDDIVLARAADLWALAHRTGQSKTDADLIIAATALAHRGILVTGNTNHFEWIEGLPLTNWRIP